MASYSGKSYPQICCPEHPEASLIEDCQAGDLICPECGLVVGDRVIDVGSEWRTFGSSDKDAKDNSRVGAAENPMFDGGDLSTMIATGTASDSMRDEFGKSLYKNRRVVSSSDRTLMQACREIAQMADRLNLPKMLVDRASTLFKQVHDSKSLKGRSNDAIVSACMYIACRQDGVPRTFKEICAVSKVNKKDIGRVFKLILKSLETSVNVITTGDFMSRFCSNLSLSSVIQKAATHIARKAVEMDLVPGRSPISVAAAAIYMTSQASDNKKTARGEDSAVVCHYNRAVQMTYSGLHEMCQKLNLSKPLVDRVCVMFKTLHTSDNLKGRSKDAIASACLYLACRKEEVPRTFKEICAVSPISKHEIGSIYRVIMDTYSLKVNLITTDDFMSRFCFNLSVSPAVQKAATHIARKAVEMDLVPGRSPISVAAAAIYMASQASDDKKTAKEIGEIAGVAEVTIRESYNSILPKALELFPAEFIFYTSVENLPSN